MVTTKRPALSMLWYAVDEDSRRQPPKVPIVGPERTRIYCRLMDAIEDNFPDGKPIQQIGDQIGWLFGKDDCEADQVEISLDLNREALELAREYANSIIREPLIINRKQRNVLMMLDKFLTAD